MPGTRTVCRAVGVGGGAMRTVLTLLCLLLALPNALAPSTLALIPDGLPKSQLPLGLDLRGGSHLMLEATAQDVEKAKLESLEDTVRGELRSAEGGTIAITDLSLNRGRLTFTVTDLARVDQAISLLNKATAPLGVGNAREVEISRGSVPGQVIVTPTAAGIAAAIDGAMAQAVEVIRKRIDELGTREPTIVRQGKTRIVVQVPGLQDPEALKALLGKTAKLEFKLVDLNADPAEVAAGRAPAGPTWPAVKTRRLRCPIDKTRGPRTRPARAYLRTESVTDRRGR